MNKNIIAGIYYYDCDRVVMVVCKGEWQRGSDDNKDDDHEVKQDTQPFCHCVVINDIELPTETIMRNQRLLISLFFLRLHLFILLRFLLLLFPSLLFLMYSFLFFFLVFCLSFSSSV